MTLKSVCIPITTTGLPGYSFVRYRLDETTSLSASASSHCIWMLQMENLFESTVISFILFNPFAKNTSCVVIVSMFSSNKISLDTARDARLFYSAFSLVAMGIWVSSPSKCQTENVSEYEKHRLRTQHHMLTSLTRCLISDDIITIDNEPGVLWKGWHWFYFGLQ